MPGTDDIARVGEDDLLAAFGESPSAVTIAGVVYACMFQTREISETEYQAVGSAVGRITSLLMRTTDFVASSADSGTAITVNEVPYIVETAKRIQDGAVMRVGLLEV
jgi:hypothetical protein